MRISYRAMMLLPLGALVVAAAPQDPMTIFGLTLGAPLSIPQCAHKVLTGGLVSEFTYEDDPAQACYEPDIQLSDAPWRRGSVNFPLKRMPLILHINTGYTLILDGKLEGLEFSTLGYGNTDGIIHELTSKFGKPTSTYKTTSNVAGVEVPSIETEWKLAMIYVRYNNVSTSVEYGALQIQTPKMHAFRLNFEKRKASERTAL